jgi:hypothetical protein
LFLATSMLVPLIRRYDNPLWKNPKANIKVIIHYTQSQYTWSILLKKVSTEPPKIQVTAKF